jgi:ABC-type multidrug transport system fused ATPase/permease subunit
MNNNKNKNNNIIAAFKTLPQVFSLLYKNDKKYLLIMLLEVVAFSIDKYPELLIMKYTIDALTNKVAYSSYVKGIIPLIAVMLLLKMLRVIINTSRPCRDQVITEKLFNAFFSQCMKIDYQTLESKEMQDKKELAKFIANGKIAAIGWYFVEMFSSLIALIIATVFMINISPIVLVIVILGLVIKSFISKKNSDITIPISKQQIIDNRFLSYLYRIGSDYEYVKEFRIFNYKGNLYRKINEAKESYISSNNRLLKYNFIQSILYNAEDFVIKIMTFAIMGFSCLKGTIAVSNFIFVIGLVDDFISYTDSLTSSCKSYVDATAYIEYYVEFMNCVTPYRLPKSTAQPDSIESHFIEFKDVYFKYTNSSDYALKGVNLKIHVPMKISLVGRNGAGKSTLVKLLLRLYRPDEGEITLDGKSIYDYSNEKYMELFSSVFQDYALFAFTIIENITSFNSSIDYTLFHNVVNETGVADFIKSYPKLYGTYLSNAYSNDGIEFSGGEQQKIALARSVYKKSASFFVLDEPTSTYDADAEYMLYNKYEKILAEKTSIFISHRLSSCKLSDHIVLLENGRVIEEGSHNELIQNNTQYRQMFELQAKQYKWEENDIGK